jgi:hypothetical protein
MRYNIFIIIMIVMFIFCAGIYAQPTDNKITDVSVLDLSKISFNFDYYQYMYLLEYSKLDFLNDNSFKNITLDVYYVTDIDCMPLTSNFFNFDLNSFNLQLTYFMKHYSDDLQGDYLSQKKKEFINLLNERYSSEEKTKLGDLRNFESCHFNIVSYSHDINKESSEFKRPTFIHEVNNNIWSFQNDQRLLKSSQITPLKKDAIFPIYVFTNLRYTKDVSYSYGNLNDIQNYNGEFEMNYFSSYIDYFNLNTEINNLKEINKKYSLNIKREDAFKNLELNFLDLIVKSSQLKKIYNEFTIDKFSKNIQFFTPLFIDVSTEDQLKDVKFNFNSYHSSYDDEKNIYDSFLNSDYNDVYNVDSNFLDVYLLDLEKLKNGLTHLKKNFSNKNLNLVLNKLVLNKNNMLSNEISLTKFLYSRTEKGLLDEFYYPYTWEGEMPPSMEIIEELKKNEILVPRKLLLEVNFSEKENLNLNLIDSFNTNYQFLIEIDTSQVFLSEILYPIYNNSLIFRLSSSIIERNNEILNNFNNPISADFFRNKHTGEYNFIIHSNKEGAGAFEKIIYWFDEESKLKSSKKEIINVYNTSDPANSNGSLTNSNIYPFVSLDSESTNNFKYFIVDGELIIYTINESKIYTLNSDNSITQFSYDFNSEFINSIKNYYNELKSIEKYNGKYYFIGAEEICVKNNLADNDCDNIYSLNLTSLSLNPEYTKFNNSDSDSKNKDSFYPTTIHEDVLYILGINDEAERVLYSYNLKTNKLINYVILNQKEHNQSVSKTFLDDIDDAFLKNNITNMYIIENKIVFEIYVDITNSSMVTTFIYDLDDIKEAYYTYGDFINFKPVHYNGRIFEQDGKIYSYNFDGYNFDDYDYIIVRDLDDFNTRKFFYNNVEKSSKNDDFFNHGQSNVIIDDEGILRTVNFIYDQSTFESKFFITSVEYFDDNSQVYKRNHAFILDE